MGLRTIGTLVVMAAASGNAPAAAQDTVEEPSHQNLQVLPADISRSDLGDVMLGFLQSLGLPRRGGAGCLHCHSGDLDRPRSEWDWAADVKPAKQTARRMIAMTRAINNEHLAALPNRNAPELQVGCMTCHRGRVDPRPIRDVLDAVYDTEGADGVVSTYRRLHAEYFGSDAYDLRVGTLSAMASELAESGAYDDALAISAVNEETHASEASARRFTLTLELQRALDSDGPQEALDAFHRMRTEEPEGVVTYGLLDGLGWRTFRLDRQPDAIALFRANREAFPDLYFTFESLTEALYGAGEISLEAAMAEYEGWLRDHPGHEMAQVQLTNLRRRR